LLLGDRVLAGRDDYLRRQRERQTDQQYGSGERHTAWGSKKGAS
jgi:hypothetical protein